VARARKRTQEYNWALEKNRLKPRKMFLNLKYIYESNLLKTYNIFRLKGTMVVLALVGLLAPACTRQAVRDSNATDAATLTAKVDSLFEEWDKPDSPGCALGVIQSGELVYRRGYGMASLEDTIPISSTTTIYVASIVKQFIAASVLLAADQGHLTLEDDIRKYVPELPDYGTPITIRQLIHHTSGLRGASALAWLPTMQWQGQFPTDEEKLSALVRQKELNFTPGTDFAYTGTNYALLKLIIKRATGTPIWEFADANIFAPLGMESTQIHHDDPHGAIGYSRNRENGFRPTAIRNRGGMYTSVEDFLRWEQNFYENKLGREDFARRLVTPGTLKSGEELSYAYGLNIGEYKGLRTVAHGGSFWGFRAATLRFPDQEFSVVCFCNVGVQTQALASQVADLYLRDEFKVSEGDSVDVSEEDLKDLTGTYLSPSGRVFTLSLKDGVLGIVSSRGTNPLVPLSKTRFRAGAIQFRNNEYQFYREGPDSPWQFDVILPIAGIRATRGLTWKAVHLVSPTPSQLEEYVGEYKSDEVPATYRVVLEEEQLALVAGGNARKFPLKATIKDGFIVEGRITLEFIRDDQGRVAGFGVQAGGRIWNLHFVKKD